MKAKQQKEDLRTVRKRIEGLRLRMQYGTTFARLIQRAQEQRVPLAAVLLVLILGIFAASVIHMGTSGNIVSNETVQYITFDAKLARDTYLLGERIFIDITQHDAAYSII